ncbi:hypothetical protein phiOC_p197 [Ochrobactrum phage vB_OspM_OC]|nr:hypothetical protein phiOC_p197 [Ochrobactrum phage vB_OspM_OC]
MTSLIGVGFVNATPNGVAPDYMVFLTGETETQFVGNLYKVVFDETTFGPSFQLAETNFKFDKNDNSFWPHYRINPEHNAAVAILPQHVYALDYGHA